MNPKVLGTIGLLFLVISQVLLAQGFDFLQGQKPIDFAHWFMLSGAVLSLAFSFVFPKGIIHTIATVLTVIGVIAHVGMCTIDFVLWSFGQDMEGRDSLIFHLMDTPSIWLPFMVVGPAFLYVGLSFHAWKFIRSHTVLAIMTLLSSTLIGLGQFLFQNRLWVVVGTILFALGLVLLAFRKEN
ncbi:MAG: hypothetical protein AAGA10_07310 [Bacteroidota bacterium]